MVSRVRERDQLIVDSPADSIDLSFTIVSRAKGGRRNGGVGERVAGVRGVGSARGNRERRCWQQAVAQASKRKTRENENDNPRGGKPPNKFD